MTIRAVDMQTLVPRAGEAGRMQQQVQSHSQVVQHAQTEALKAQVDRAQHQVTHKPQAEQTSVRRDGRGQGGGAGGGRGEQQGRPRGERSQATAGTPVEPGRGHRLDVKL